MPAPTERELKETLNGVQLPAVTNGSPQPPATVQSQAWTESYRYSRDEIKMIAQTAVGAGIFNDAKEANKALIRILWGIENGLTPVEALNDVYESKGRFYMYADAVVTKMAKGGGYVKITEHDPTVCVAHLEDAQGERWTPDVKFTIGQAKAMGLLSKAPWQNDPESMLFARVVARLKKRGGGRFWQSTVGVREEIEDVEYLDRQQVAEDPATKVIAAAGKRKRTQSTPTSEPESAPSNAQETSEAEVVNAEPAKLPAKELRKPASPEQRGQMIAAAEEAGISEDELEEFLDFKYGPNSDNPQTDITVEMFQAAMLWIQGKAEGVR